MKNDCFAGLQPEKGEVQVNGIRIHFLTWGDSGQDMVMLHGITSSALTWWRVAPEMARAGYRVTALDMPGHGDSGRDDGSYHLAETARTVDAFLVSQGIQSPIVMGHSWGGGVSLVHATDPGIQVHPRNVILVDPLLRMLPGHVTQYREALIELLGKSRQEQATLLRGVYPNWHDCDVQWKAEALEKGSPAAVRGVFNDNVELDLVPRLLDVPGHWALIAADPAHGGILPHAMWAALKEAAERNRGQIFDMPGVAHDIHREDFPGFMSLLSTFLASVE